MNADPITTAVADAAEAGARRALADHMPKLTLTRSEAAEVLGVSMGTVDALTTAGQIEALVKGRLTLASVLRCAGWPVAPAPVGAPLTVIGGAA